MGRIDKVLIISKMTELEFDENRYGAAVDEYHRLMKTDVDRLEENHEYHYSCLEKIVGAFRHYGVSPGIIKKQNLGRSDFKEHWDLIVPTGGDGTFMDAARYVRDETLFFGIKSSPRSVGGHYDANFSNAEDQIGKVMEGKFSVELRARIEGRVHNEIPVTDLALNDLYIGDRYIVGYSRLVLRLRDETFEVGGNGIVFSTYHGRTGWYDNIPIPERDPQLAAAVAGFLAQRGGRQEVRLANSRCDFTAEETGDIKYKLLMRDAKKKTTRPDWGIIRPGETCTVVSRVPSNGCVSFDGNKTARPRHRMYDLPHGSTVTVRVSDKPLHIVKVDQAGC